MRLIPWRKLLLLTRLIRLLLLLLMRLLLLLLMRS